MKANFATAAFAILFGLVLATPLNQTSIDALNEVYPRCFDQNNSTVKSVSEEEGLFAKKLKVTLAPRAKCSFLSAGNAKLEWEP